MAADASAGEALQVVRRHAGESPDQLSVERGDAVVAVARHTSGWVYVRRGEATGWVPARCVQKAEKAEPSNGGSVPESG